MIIGLANSDEGKKYLEEKYGLSYVGTVAGVPTYFDPTSKIYFVGGFKGIHSVIIGETEKILAKLDTWRRGKRVRYSFSMDRDPFKSNRLSFVLDVLNTTKEDRGKLYEYNARKHIKHANGGDIVYQAGDVPIDEWYDLYSSAIKELGTNPRTIDWFNEIKQSFPGKILCITARDGSTIVGVLYCLFTEHYINLLFIAAKPQYRGMRIHYGLYDQAVAYAIEHSIRFVDFGPAMRSDVSHWKVKEDFGAEMFYFADKSFLGPWGNFKEAAHIFWFRVRRFLSRMIK